MTLSPQQCGANRAGGPLYRPAGQLPPLVAYVDPRAVQRVRNSSDSDPFGVDPQAVQVVS